MSCKLLENIIHSSVTEHLEHYNIKTDAQHRFWSKWAWETQLIKSVNDLVKISNNGEQIDSISKALYLKAFAGSLAASYTSNYSTTELGVNYWNILKTSFSTELKR